MKLQEIIKKVKPKAKITKTANMFLFEVTHEELLGICLRLRNDFSLLLKTIKATDEREQGNGFKIFYVFALKGETDFLALYFAVDEQNLIFPTLSKEIYQATFYELEIYTFFGLTPVGNPKLSRFILHENMAKNVYPLRKDFAWDKQLPFVDGEPTVFQKVGGEGIYEISVGPVHAGIIEPGHFRFSVAGEEIVALEPKLGFVHKGSEKLFETLSLADKVRLSEEISGDTSFSQSLAFCQAVETLGKITVPQRALSLRVVFSELERLANHINDIGFILNDTGFAYGGSFGQRLKEKVMQLNDQLTGNRFLRGVNVVGGVAKNISIEQAEQITLLLKNLQQDFNECIDLVEDNEAVINRLKKTGTLKTAVAWDHGVVGIAARATGIVRDARIDHSYAAYKKLDVQMAVESTGDVYARYRVRVREVIEAIRIILLVLSHLPKGEIQNKDKFTLAKNSCVIGITEGWRGDIVYFVATDSKGGISRVGVRDASFLNWLVVPYAVVGNIVPDFPLINKSFNLSYSGFDR